MDFHAFHVLAKCGLCVRKLTAVAVLQPDGGRGRTMNHKTIYLCGPIMDCKPGETKDWRTRAKERLAGRFVLLDPMRRNFRDNEIDSSNEIVEFDLQDVRDADL